MNIHLDGQPLLLRDQDLIGEGGEARVYAHGPNDVVKIFHDGAPAALLHLRQQKLRALTGPPPAGQRIPIGLPKAFVTPQALAENDQGDVVGYRMRRVSAAVDIARLARAQVRSSSVDANRVLLIFRQLIEALAQVHALSVVVGDLNDGNIVIADDGNGLPFFIDTDSMQLGNLPCPVAHERFVDPLLYGADLLQKPCFSPASDHYALRVLLFQSLCCVHPYGGTHPKLPTLLRRAEARHSALRPDVVLPRMALRPDALPEALRADLWSCFDEGARSLLSPLLLDVKFVRCACGFEHAHRCCPACQVKVAMPAVSVQAGVSLLRVSRPGTVVAASSCGGVLRLLIDDGVNLWREVRLASGETRRDLVLQGRHLGLSFGFVSDQLWVASAATQQCELVALDPTKVDDPVVERTSTGAVFGAAAWAASPAGLFRLHGDAIVHHHSGVVVAKALLGRTWLFPVHDGCVAVWRAGKVARLLWCRPGQAPVDHALPALPGRVVDLHVSDDNDDRVLLGIAFDHEGVRRHRLTLLSRTKGVLAHLEGRPDDHAILGNIRGKILSGNQLLSTSPHGLMLVDALDFSERARFPDTSAANIEHGVDDCVDLLRGSSGDIFVVSDAAIHLLRRRAATGTTTNTSNRSTP